MSWGPTDQRHRELVGLIAGFFSEQLRDAIIVRANQVDGEMRRCGRDRGRVVLLDKQTRNRDGLMLTWVVKPIRQPALTPAADVVAMYIG